MDLFQFSLSSSVDTPRLPSPVTVLWACLLLVNQRNSVWIINGEWGSEEEGVDVRGYFWVQCCRKGRGVGGDGLEVSLTEFF